MSQDSSGRVEFVLRLPMALVVIGLSLCRVTSPSFGASSDSKIPGHIPKAPPYVSGFPIPFPRSADYRQGPGGLVVTDIDDDGRSDLVVSVPSGLIAVLGSDGSPLPGWPRSFAGLPQPAYPKGPPAVGDLDGDGTDEIVACVVAGGEPLRSFAYVLRLDGRDLPGWPVELDTAGPGAPSCSLSGVMTADLDADGRMEVVIGMSLDKVLALDGDGWPLPGWPVVVGPDDQGRPRGLNARPAAADLDGDGGEEAIFVESGTRPRLFAVSWNGHPNNGFPVTLDEVVGLQGPVAGDLDGDGAPEVVQSTLPDFGDVMGDASTDGEPVGDGPLVPAALHVLRADGSALSGWPRRLEEGGPWGPVLADLTGDGHLDILQQDGDRLLAFDALGNLVPGFPLTVHREFLRSDSLRVSPWVVTDLDGDRAPDLLNVRSNVYRGWSYMRVFGLRSGGQPLKGFPFEVEGLLAASDPVAVDLTDDGVLDLAVLTVGGTTGPWLLVAWDVGALLPSYH